MTRNELKQLIRETVEETIVNEAPKAASGTTYTFNQLNALARKGVPIFVVYDYNGNFIQIEPTGFYNTENDDGEAAIGVDAEQHEFIYGEDFEEIYVGQKVNLK